MGYVTYYVYVKDPSKRVVISLLTTIYHTGVRLTKQAMAEVETHIQRLSGLERWFVEISCAPSASPDT